MQHLYTKEKPTDGLVSIGKALLKKERKVIAVDDMQRLHDWLQENNRYFLLVCYFLHYMLIRPKEIAKLRLCDISVSKQTVYIDDTISKNKRSACVTIPQKIIELMAELGYFDAPGTYYIFSKDFRPGPEWVNEKTYRDFWSRKIRPALRTDIFDLSIRYFYLRPISAQKSSVFVHFYVNFRFLCYFFYRFFYLFSPLYSSDGFIMFLSSIIRIYIFLYIVYYIYSPPSILFFIMPDKIL